MSGIFKVLGDKIEINYHFSQLDNNNNDNNYFFIILFIKFL